MDKAQSEEVKRYGAMPAIAARIHKRGLTATAEHRRLEMELQKNAIRRLFPRKRQPHFRVKQTEVLGKEDFRNKQHKNQVNIAAMVCACSLGRSRVCPHSAAHTAVGKEGKMFTTKFGLEVEFTGITREEAAEAAAHYLGGTVSASGGYYDVQKIKAPDGRIWKFMYDGSIHCQKKDGRRTVSASNSYSVELVTPILLYREDIDAVQALARRLRKAGGFTNRSCGIHIHLDGFSHTARSIRNFVNIIAGHNDLFYKSLQIAPERMRYCKKMDAYLVKRMNKVKPTTLSQIESIWYENYTGSRNGHYHDSRYHFLNLHSFFHGNHTVELRGFNSTLHAGKIRAYIVLALALNHQALTQKSASSRKVQEENEKFAMRVYLNRIGFIGDEFKACREHLYRHLDGNAAWRYGSRGNVRSHAGARNIQNGDDEV